jgi:hypothetical protein
MICFVRFRHLASPVFEPVSEIKLENKNRRGIIATRETVSDATVAAITHSSSKRASSSL